MTEFEKAMVEKFAHDVADREKRAKEAINNLNFGIARAILEEPMPTLEFNVTVGMDLGEGESTTAVAILDTKRGKKGKTKALMTNLDVPFSGAEFLEAWGRLLSTKEWSKKTVSQLQWNLDRLKAYPEEFATILVNEAFNGGRNGTYLGVVFESTPSKYERWLAQKNAIIVGGGAPIGQHTMYQHPAAKPSKVQSALGEAQRAISMIDNLFPEGGTTDEQ